MEQVKPLLKEVQDGMKAQNDLFAAQLKAQSDALAASMAQSATVNVAFINRPLCVCPSHTR